jgi:sulfite reductase (NADPH) hemoprotein beta-component
VARARARIVVRRGRDNIHTARIKIIVNQLGIDKYRALVDEEWERIKDGPLRLTREYIDSVNAYFAPPAYEPLEDIGEVLAKRGEALPKLGRWLENNVAAHKAPGYAIVNVSLKAPGAATGDITADKMDAVADLAERYSLGEIRVNHRQNLVLPNVRQSDLEALWRELDALELATPNIGLLTDIVCCPGLDFCALANARSIPVARDIAMKFYDVDYLAAIGNFTINISGCMNACGHHHVGHIGILGVDKRNQEFFQLTLGGSSDQHASIGDRLGPALPQDEVPAAIQSIVDVYLEIRETGERFLDTYRRVGMTPFKEAVYGVDASKAVA